VPAPTPFTREGLHGWSWDARADAWAEYVAQLRVFAEREGHAHVPQRHTENGTKRCTWVSVQRSYRGTLPPERRARRESTPGWTWDPYPEGWDENYAALERFVDPEGHARVPQKHVENGVKLGSWVAEQRANEGKLSKERRARLEALPGWSWSAVADALAGNLAALHAFVDREGHARVPVPRIPRATRSIARLDLGAPRRCLGPKTSLLCTTSSTGRARPGVPYDHIGKRNQTRHLDLHPAQG
jgi:hypothetical protein